MKIPVLKQCATTVHYSAREQFGMGCLAQEHLSSAKEQTGTSPGRSIECHQHELFSVLACYKPSKRSMLSLSVQSSSHPGILTGWTVWKDFHLQAITLLKDMKRVSQRHLCLSSYVRLFSIIFFSIYYLS